MNCSFACILVTSEDAGGENSEEEIVVSPDLGAAQKQVPGPKGPCDLSASLSSLFLLSPFPSFLSPLLSLPFVFIRLWIFI